MINCENKSCLYQRDGICTRYSVDISAKGSCSSCVLIDADEEILKKLAKYLHDQRIKGK